MTDKTEDKRLRAQFVRYVAGYAARLSEQAEHVRLKRDHSLRVHVLALNIAARVKLPWLRLVSVAALLHDLGRFSQLERFGTFRDDLSVDHGQEGARLLAETDFLAPFSPVDVSCVIEVVRQHNKRHLPDDMEPRTRMICEVIRDADKLDIIALALPRLQPDVPHDPILTLSLTDEPESWSASVFQAAASGQTPLYADLRVVNDLKILLAAWGPLLVHAASRRIFARRDYLGRLFALLPQTQTFAALQADLSFRLGL